MHSNEDKIQNMEDNVEKENISYGKLKQKKKDEYKVEHQLRRYWS